jgi:hypothetical protein
MGRKRFSSEQIIVKLREAEIFESKGLPQIEAANKLGMSRPRYLYQIQDSVFIIHICILNLYRLRCRWPIPQARPTFSTDHLKGSLKPLSCGPTGPTLMM